MWFPYSFCGASEEKEMLELLDKVDFFATMLELKFLWSLSTWLVASSCFSFLLICNLWTCLTLGVNFAVLFIV